MSNWLRRAGQSQPIASKELQHIDKKQLGKHLNGMTALHDLLAEMRSLPTDHMREYFCFTLTANAKGQIELGCQSIWAGFADPESRIELRAARRLNLKMASIFDRIGEPCLFVHTDPQMAVFLAHGGHALVASEIAERCIPDWLEPTPSIGLGPFGFEHLSGDMQGVLKRAPSPKLRMEVLKRDRRQCRICGRSPDDDVHVRLETHHIRPWGRKGVTVAKNLLTLCQTCHSGLDPHYDYSLYQYLRDECQRERRSEHDKAVQRYRDAIMDDADSDL